MEIAATLSPSIASHEAVIGLDFGGTKTDVALADGDGKILERVRLATMAAEGPTRALAAAAEAARALAITASDCHEREVVAYAAVTPGLPHEDGVLLAPNLPGWERLPFGHSLAEQLEVEAVEVANDVRAGALAELRLGALKDSDPGLYVSIGTGLGAALVVGGVVIAGAHGAAGEIGYSAIDLEASPQRGTAPLEEIVGGRALGDAASRALGGSLDAATLFRRADPEARRIVARALGTLGGALANLVLLVDPARIVLGGGLMADADRILPAICRRLDNGAVFSSDVVVARFVQDASLYGAITLALDGVVRGRATAEHRSDGGAGA